MKNSLKVVFALIMAVVVTGYAVSCSSKTETTNDTADTTKVDTTTIVAPPADTTTQATDTTTAQ
jgi:hypothetical protein